MNLDKSIVTMWEKISNNWQLVIISLVVFIVTAIQLTKIFNKTSLGQNRQSVIQDSSWQAPSLYYDAVEGEERKLIAYGQELIAHTSKYLGPRGSVSQLSNGMNCQNCHLNAGKKNWGNNFSAVYATYPKYRARSGSTETIYKRVSDCFERSLDGTAPDSNSREYQAIYTYMKWLGKDVKKGEKPIGSGIVLPPYLGRAADPAKGKLVYIKQCASCHGVNGEGLQDVDAASFSYPPLWGPHSYNDGAGLYRISNFAGYVKSNMPFEQATHNNPKLTDEEAWDVAAYVNSQPRPKKNQENDWPDISQKPFDHPFGPYADTFSETQHKYGPFKPIIAAKKLPANNKK